MRVVVIGSGAAGNIASFTVRKLCPDADVSIFSEDSLPEYSPCLLTDYIAGSISRQQLFLKSFSDYEERGIRTFFGEEVLKIDPAAKKVYSKERVARYDRLILATGSSPVIPKIAGVDKKGVFTLKSLQDVDGILAHPGKRVVVVGSGPIGTHASVAFMEKGYTVHLIELLNSILPAVFDEKPASIIQRAFEEHGINVLTGEKVLEIIGNGKVTIVRTSKRSVDCDMVILAAGMKPNVGLAAEAGLKLGDHCGIKVNKQMMTSEADIFACGDCVETESVITGRPALSLLWPSARIQGTVAAHNCCGKARSHPGTIDVIGVNLSRFHAVSMGLIGNSVNNQDLEIIEKEYPSHYYRFLLSNKVLVGAQFINRTRYSGTIFSVLQKKTTVDMIRYMVEKRKLPSASALMVGK